MTEVNSSFSFIYLLYLKCKAFYSRLFSGETSLVHILCKRTVQLDEEPTAEQGRHQSVLYCPRWEPGGISVTQLLGRSIWKRKSFVILDTCLFEFMIMFFKFSCVMMSHE